MSATRPTGPRRLALLGLGWLLIVTAPITSPLPGPGATIMFLAGVAILLRNSAWAKRRFVWFKRRWPRLGHYADRGLRRPSVARRMARAVELTSPAPSPNAPANEAVPPSHRSDTSVGTQGEAAVLRSEIREDYHEADLSAVEPGAGPSPRLPQPHGDAGRPQGDSRPPCPRPQGAVGVSAPSAATGRLTTITKRRDFLAANRGRRAPMPGFVLLVRPRGDGDAGMRVGFTVTRKVGNAVVRNRMKRRLRALSRELLPTAGIPGADHILIGREGGIERDFALLRSELGKALAKVARA